MSSGNLTIRDIEQKESPVTCLTCYDYLTARVMDRETDLDMILVGDSLGMVMLGHDNTISVTLDDMVHHTKAVSRGVDRAFLVADVPFLEMAKDRTAVIEAVQVLMQEGGAQAIKIEGGRRHGDLLASIIDHDIPVIGHLGLTPQSVEAFGGYQIQGQTVEEISQLGEQARFLQEQGISGLVLECVPKQVAQSLTRELDVPTIGIGAGASCDGQVLVWQDMMGLSGDQTPGFVKQWDSLDERLAEAVQSFCDSVEQNRFPTEEQSPEAPGDISSARIDEIITSLF